MNGQEHDLFGEAYEDFLEVLHENSVELQTPEECKSYITFLSPYSPLRTSENRFTYSHGDPTGCTWRDHVMNTPYPYDEESLYHNMPNIQEEQTVQMVHPSAPPQKHGSKKLRLFEYLHEALHDPDLRNCIQWVDKANGIFQFVSKNKERLAELWGKKKGNRKIMTYQKMARALRNYGRTGEILKIRRKLMYQFSAIVLQRLSPVCSLDNVFYQYVQPGVEYWSTHDCWDNSRFVYNSGYQVYPQFC
ncbi:hypothetical protein XELAEV_18021310mg [Xenopus laevis]|uniref:Transcription factor Spi-C n=1 Tax=Xenopus laevis TaxID=8355 RepID=A0A974D999_XENLA|nr:hypothetical protein XELAEV_18021310mg [Xenopus laevis]